MTAEEILAKLAEADGLYIEVGDWVLSKSDEAGVQFGAYTVARYRNLDLERCHYFDTLPEALEHTLK